MPTPMPPPMGQSPLVEANEQSLQHFFDLDPFEASTQDIEGLVRVLREQRAGFRQKELEAQSKPKRAPAAPGEKPAKAPKVTSSAGMDLLAKLGLGGGVKK